MSKIFPALLLLLHCTILTVNAQTKESKRSLRVQAISSIGLLNGSNGSSPGLQTILGTTFQKSFAGVGVGLDYYRFRTIPVFADFRQYFGNGKRNVFLYADIGYHLDWLTAKDKARASFSSKTDYSGGIYYDTGVGYKVGITKSDDLIFTAGYSMKRMKNSVGTGICPIAGPCFEEFQTYKYTLPRVLLKAGWVFK